MENAKLIIVVPCYNEEEMLEYTTRELVEVIARLKSGGKMAEGKILYVDDGSRDSTWKLIERLSHEHVEVVGLKLAHNVGHQNALWAGLEWAAEHGDVTISIDADLQDDTRAIDEMMDAYALGADIVYGVRSSRERDTFFKRTTAEAFYRLMNALGAETVFNHADYRLMSRRALEGLSQFREVNLFLRGIVPMIGYRTDVVTYERGERFAGESKYPLKKMLAFALEGITSLSVKPLRLITGLGFFVFLVSLFMILYNVIRWVTGNTVTGWASISCSVWLIGGLILLALGVIGEYVGKLYMEAKGRPRFLVSDVVDEQD